MKSHLYKFTIEYEEDTKGNKKNLDPLVFQTRSHDDIIKIVEKMENKMQENTEDSKALAVGIKLFAEAMLKNKEKEPFKELFPSFKIFMKELKKS